MTYHRIHLDVDSSYVDPYSIYGHIIAEFRGAIDDHGIEKLGTPHDIDDDDIDDDEITAEDIMAVMEQRVRSAETPERAAEAMREARSRLTSSNRYMRVIDNMLEMAEAGATTVVTIEATDSDPTPPHGTPRPQSKGVTKGSGQKTPGMQSVPCPECRAPIGERCRTANGLSYYEDYGHSARKLVFKSQPPV